MQQPPPQASEERKDTLDLRPENKIQSEQAEAVAKSDPIDYELKKRLDSEEVKVIKDVNVVRPADPAPVENQIRQVQ